MVHPARHGLYRCGDPRARPNPVGESEPKPRGRSVEVINQIPFVSVLLNFSFKRVATRNPDLTRLEDPSRSPVYSDISIILSKHLVYFIHFKFCKFRGSNPFWQAHKTFTINKRFTTFTFNKMPLQKYQSRVQTVYKISMFERNGVMHVTEHTP